MITVSLPDSPLRLVPGAVWRFVVPTWLSCGVVSPFSPGGFWKGCVAKLPAINPDSTKFYYPIWLSIVDSTWFVQGKKLARETFSGPGQIEINLCALLSFCKKIEKISLAKFLSERV